MHTQVALGAIAPVVYGYHENPFEILGPHEVEENGRRALAVRAFLPDAQRAWVVDPRDTRDPADEADSPGRPV